MFIDLLLCVYWFVVGYWLVVLLGWHCVYRFVLRYWCVIDCFVVLYWLRIGCFIVVVGVFDGNVFIGLLCVAWIFIGCGCVVSLCPWDLPIFYCACSVLLFVVVLLLVHDWPCYWFLIVLVVLIVVGGLLVLA